MIWEHCQVSLRRQSRNGSWRAEVRAHGTAAPMAGWVPTFDYYGAEEWELVTSVPSSFGADAEGLFLSEAIVIFKRPVTSNGLKHRLRASVAVEGSATNGH